MTGAGDWQRAAKIFGVAGEWDTGVIDNALVHRRCDHGIEFATQAAIHRAIQGIQNIAAIGDIWRPAYHGCYCL